MVRLKSRMAACALLALSAVFLCAPHVGGQIPCSYTVEYLPTLPPCWPSTVPRHIEPWDISPNGRYVCGWVGVCPSYAYQAVVVDTQTMAITFIPVPSGVSEMRAHGVNDKMEVTGTMNLSSSGERGFLWQNSQVINLGLPAGVPPSGSSVIANAINSSTEITGTIEASGISRRAYIWKQGTMTMLDLPSASGMGEDIDQESRIVGSMGNPLEAFIWHNSTTIALGFIPGGYSARATSIAQNGTIAGFGGVPGGDFGYARSFVFRNDAMVNIGALPGFLHSRALDTNNWVTVGGCDNYPEMGWEAFRYSLVS